MPWLIVLVVLFACFHFLLFAAVQFAILTAVIVTVGLWILWKLKWIILGIIGLEEIFGGRSDN